MENISNKPLSAIIVEVADRYWQRMNQAWPELAYELTAEQGQELYRIMGLSDFIAEQLCRHPEWIPALFDGQLDSVSRSDFDKELQELLCKCVEEDEVKAILRHYRNRQMVRLAWRDFFNYVSLEDSLLDLSALAEALIISARDWLYIQVCKQYGTPCDSEGEPQPLIIIGMGKLGGRELNFSSDIDLIFTFPEHGETQGGRRSIDNQQFFIRMGQHLVNLLHQVTMNGFVYRVDMRLRPYGDSGPLVVSFSGLEDYYQEQGRDWERYAMVKARALGPWSCFSDRLHSMLRPFVYRRYIDFSAIESLRKMKQLITQEVRRRQLTDNIKLGAGGIREVEFVVQSFQLIRGGREPLLRQQSLFAAIDTLYHLGQLEYLAVDELKQSYLLLRRVENLLQAIGDQQTQTLPDNSVNWYRLCHSMGMGSEAELRTHIESAMSKINRHFTATVGGQIQDEGAESWTQQLWNAQDDDHAQALIKEQMIEDLTLWPQLKLWRETIINRSLGPRGRDTLDKLMPCLLKEFTNLATPSIALSSVSNVIDKILTRTTYLELLYENPGARQQLVSLCCASSWIATQLAKFPMLLDELIDPTQLYDTTSLDDYVSELRQYLLRVSEEDMEQQMEALRQFKLSQQLKIAAADITGVLPVSQVSDHLTLLAEAIIEQVVMQAWQQVSARYGVPDYLEDGMTGFAVIGYGKAGGIELGYGSDLDLVFLHNFSREKYPDQGETNGTRPIEVGHFYLKLAQRILHLFSTRTTSGELYEVDMRLRPSGASGLLVSEIEYFGQYQREEAWTWEHQSLVRARFMFGCNRLSSRFNELKSQIIEMPRDKSVLAKEVIDMRIKMRDHLLKSKAGMFDLKQSPGGILDIEFIAQYLVLANANEHNELSFWSDNIRIFASLGELNLLSNHDVESLIEAYLFLRDEIHRQTLQLKLTEKSQDLMEKHAIRVLDIYHRVFDS